MLYLSLCIVTVMTGVMSSGLSGGLKTWRESVVMVVKWVQGRTFASDSKQSRAVNDRFKSLVIVAQTLLMCQLVNHNTSLSSF